MPANNKNINVVLDGSTVPANDNKESVENKKLKESFELILNVFLLMFFNNLLIEVIFESAKLQQRN